MNGFEWLSQIVEQRGLWLGSLAALLGGLALNLTPCVYPMVPVTLGFFSNQASGASRRTFALAAVYVLGISFSYAVLGVLAARTGALFGSWLQQPGVLLAISLVIVALALSSFGLYELQPPQFILRRIGQASAGFGGAFVMGLLVGVVAAPCVGPIILSLLLLVGHMADPVAGFILFFMLGLGMGLPYLALGAAANRFSRLPKAGAWLVWSKKALGMGLLGGALHFARPLLSPTVFGLLVIGLLCAAGAYLGWLERTKGGRAFLAFRWTVGAACLGLATLLLWPRVPSGPRMAWTPYSVAALEQARQHRQPVLIDVYADWCLPCVEMDHTTFRNPDVIEALRPVATLRVDATRDISPEAAQLLKQYQVYGAPTILVFDRQGAEREDLRVLGYINADGVKELLRRLQ